MDPSATMNADPLQSLWQMVQGLQQEVNVLKSENESLRATVSAVPTPQTDTSELPVRRKAVMSDPFIFNGDKSLYPQWKGLMLEKLDVDGWIYPTEKVKIAYTSSRLGPDLAGQVTPWKDQHRDSPTEYTLKGLLEYYKGLFGDPQKAE